MSAIVEWRGEQVLQFVAGLVAERLATAGKLVEDDARGRLEAIDDPEWGAGYRNEVVGRLLTSYVEKADTEVLAHVGVRSVGGKGGGYHGFFIEIGSHTAPAHPWLRPALFENGPDIVKLLGD